MALQKANNCTCTHDREHMHRGVCGRWSDLEEVEQVLEDADANLVQVLEEAVEDGHQVGCRQLVAQDHRQLMDGEGQRPTHLPLFQDTMVQVTSIPQCYKLLNHPFWKTANCNKRYKLKDV